MTSSMSNSIFASVLLDSNYQGVKTDKPKQTNARGGMEKNPEFRKPESFMEDNKYDFSALDEDIVFVSKVVCYSSRIVQKMSHQCPTSQEVRNVRDSWGIISK